MQSMKRLKKRILGLLGLIAVIIMTAVAYSMPTNAAEDLTTIVQEITVSVYDKYPTIEITSFNDGDIYLEDILNVEYNYSNASRVEFELKRTDGTIIDSWTDDLGHFEPGTVPTGTVNHDLDLASHGYGEYILSLKAVGGSEYLTFEDSMLIKFYAIQVIYIGDTANGEPVFDIYYRKEADKVAFDIYTEAGVPLFDPILTYPSATDKRYYLIDPTGAF